MKKGHPLSQQSSLSQSYFSTLIAVLFPLESVLGLLLPFALIVLYWLLVEAV